MLLNPIIKGWITYHRHIVAKKSFSKLGHEIHKILWQWSKKRHLNKSKHWIKNNYFKSIRGNTWSFACNVQNIDRVSTTYELVNPAKLPIKRHIKILSEANPYDRQWNNYFEKRLKHKMYESLSDNRKLLSIWNRQKGKCPNCKQPITLSKDWDIHHVIPKSKGSDNRNSNLMMLHINCHKQIHNPRSKCNTGSTEIELKEA